MARHLMILQVLWILMLCLLGAWWVAVIPGSALFVTTLAVSRLGDGLRDWLDPKLRSRA